MELGVKTGRQSPQIGSNVFLYKLVREIYFSLVCG